MRMIVLDILMGGVVVLAIVIMVPMPWLLAPSRYYAISENKVIGCDVTAQKMLSEPSDSLSSLMVLWLTPQPLGGLCNHHGSHQAEAVFPR